MNDQNKRERERDQVSVVVPVGCVSTVVTFVELVPLPVERHHLKLVAE